MFKRTLKSIAAAGLALAMTAAPAHAAQTIHIGSQIPLSGSLARVGTAMHEGIQVAVDQFNEAHASEYEVVLHTIDDESSPAKAISAVDKMASEGVIAFTSGYGSNIIGPASAAAHEAGIPYITSGGVAEALVERGYEDFFRLNNMAGYYKAMGGLLLDMGVKKVSILYSNKESPTGLAQELQTMLEAEGVEVAMHQFDAGTHDFKALMNRVKLRDRPEAIVMSGYENDYIGILRAGTVLQPDVKAVVAPWSLATGQMAQEFTDLVDTVYGTSMLPYPVEFTKPKAQAFAAAYEAEFGHGPDYLAQFGYVQTRILLEAIMAATEAGTLEQGGISQYLHENTFPSLIGKVDFNESGDNELFTQRMGQHQDGEVALVWPDEAATGEMVFPAVPWNQ